MNNLFKTGFSKKIPQNLIVKYPLYGGVVITFFTVAFALLYKPLGSHAGRFLGYEATMTVYALLCGITVSGLILVLKQIKFFSHQNDLNLGKELSAIIILLFGMGLTLYFAAFVIEEPASRWNFETFFDSVRNAFLIGIIPFLFFTVINVSRREIVRTVVIPAGVAPNEELIQINSQLKKEKLSFYPSQLIYVESESNYVNFYLQNGEKLQKKVIRNSIIEIEKQLANTPYLFRTHRAFIVNLKKIKSVKGNSLGYRLQLSGTNQEIPVSRNQTREFNQLYKEFC
ncbi:MAG TPA: LytTR family transcriptional regulator [Prolixibacteraceae bacterium]|nr:LytTR family transcriptional regulator [Prolixibacteraceae bacterium]